MYNRNNGSTEQEKLQNRFTSFITRIIARDRMHYLKSQNNQTKYEIIMEFEDFALIPDNSDFVADLCESDFLTYALMQISERERYVLFARAIEEKRFEEIGDEIGVKYKGVAAIYYRTTEKLRNILLKGE